MTQRNGGFTIVELLIVVVVIAILTAITIVSYNGITQRANASSAQSTASQVAKKVLAYAVTNGDVFPTALSQASIADATAATVQYRVNNSASPRTFCATATTGRASYYINNTTNTSPTLGACPGHGAGGVQLITNMAHDPAATTLNNAGNGRWANDRYTSYNSYELLTGMTGGPAGLTTAARLRVTTPSNVAIGFHLSGNTDSLGTPPAIAIPVGGGMTYAASAYARWTGTSGQTLYLIGRFGDADGTWIASSMTQVGDTVATSGVWHRISGTFVAPQNAATFTLALRRGGTAFVAGDTLDGTGLMVTEGSTIHPFGYGASPGWTWSSGAGNSPSSGPVL